MVRDKIHGFVVSTPCFRYKTPEEIEGVVQVVANVLIIKELEDPFLIPVL